jgi:hypothetical protein
MFFSPLTKLLQPNVLYILFSYLRPLLLHCFILSGFTTEVCINGSIFWNIMPCSPLKFNWRSGRTCLLLEGWRISQTRNEYDVSSEQIIAFLSVCFISFSSTLKMEAACSSETSVNFQRTMHRYIPADRTLNNRRCENFKSYIKLCIYFSSFPLFLHVLLI